MNHSFKVDHLYLHSNDDCKVIDWRYVQQTVVTRKKSSDVIQFLDQIVDQDFSPVRCEDDRNTILFLIQLPLTVRCISSNGG